MKRLMPAVFVLCLFVFVAAPALAQGLASDTSKPTPSVSFGELKPTPEMWFYEQYRQEYLDPKEAVRKKAEFRAIQRERRLAAMKWFGISNQRPRVSTDPIHGDYAPTWSSNNSFYPNRWSAVGRPWIVVWRNGSTAPSF